MKLFFCKDGVLRLYSNENTPMIPCTFIQEEMGLVDNDFAFFSRLFNKETTFEKGLTFQTFLRCLSPWIDFWSSYSQIDFESYLSYVNKPHLQKENSYIDHVEFSTLVSVESAMSYLIDGKNVRTEDIGFLHSNFREKFNPTIAIGTAFNIENLFYLRGYNNSIIHFSFAIIHTPLSEYMYAPLTLRKINNIMFNEDGSKSIMELQGKSIKKQPISDSLVFSKNFPGKQRVISGNSFEDESYSYIEGEHTFSLEQLMREMFRFMPIQPITESSDYNDIIHESLSINSSYEGKMSRESLSYQIGMTMDSLIDDKYGTNENNDEQEDNDSIDKNIKSQNTQNKIFNLNLDKNEGEKKEHIFNQSIEKENKVLNLKDFRDKKEKKVNLTEEINEQQDEDFNIILHIVEQARLKNIPLQDSFLVEQSHQLENRVMGILQPTLFETFDPLTFIKDDETTHEK